MHESAHILVVDDDKQVRRTLHAILHEEGFEVLFVRRGHKAQDLIRSENFDLIVVDVNLPDTPGAQICQEIRAVVHTPIILMSVRSNEEDKAEEFAAGADDFVVKPIAPSVLSARIRAILRRDRGTTRLDSFACGDLLIDFVKRTVTRKGKDWRLRRKEHQLLRYLVIHRGKSLPHHALLQAVWGSDYREETNILQVLINKLRKKIEADPNKPRFIVTVPWFGYRFETPFEVESRPTSLTFPRS